MSVAGLNTEVLTLGAFTDSKHLERHARDARYAAIRAACGQDYRALLVAHHRDDQAETVLTRVRNGYFGVGLRGMQELSYLSGGTTIIDCMPPRCLSPQHMRPARYVKDRLPTRVLDTDLLIEAQQIGVLRPLLDFSKMDLIATCKKAGMSWVEDATNQDVSLATRNTIRYMQQEDIMPRALQTDRLCRLANAVSTRRASIEATVDRLLDSIDVRLSLRSGQLDIDVPDAVLHSIHAAEDADGIRTALLARLISLISPARAVNSGNLAPFAQSFLQKDAGIMAFNVASLQVSIVHVKGSGYSCTMVRTTIPANEVDDLTLSIQETFQESDQSQVKWSKWHLWDGRYWIRIGHRLTTPALPHNTVIRPRLRLDDLPGNRMKPALYTSFKMYLKALGVPRAAGYSMPVIAAAKTDEPTDLTEESLGTKIVAIPTLAISGEDWTMVQDEAAAEDMSSATYFYMIRYRSIPTRFTVARHAQ